jgi:hypothetical protein
MKFRITFKDPDGVSNSLHDAAKDSARSTSGLTEKEMRALAESREEEFGEFLRKWIQYGEYVTIEFDTDADTAVVV